MRSIARRLPTRVREKGRRAEWKFRLATARCRVLPSALIIGAQKAGTTSLFAYLGAHPGVTPARTKEIHFFDIRYDLGVGWYRAHFPVRRPARRGSPHTANPLAIEATPYYLPHPLAPQRVRALLPDARLIAVLRDPVDRAISHYHQAVQSGGERLPLDAALDQEEHRLAGERERIISGACRDSPVHRRFSYVTRGHYAEQLSNWLSLFERDQLLVLDSEKLRSHPAAALARACDFLALPRRDPPASLALNVRRYEDADAHVRRRLRDHFVPHNQRLWELIGEDFGWDSEAPG